MRNTRRFYVINPTSRTYEFTWEPEGDLSEVLSSQPFRCQTRRGVVLGGRKFEMIFHFTPEEVTLHESFWRFRIPELAIEVPFLLVGIIKEPGVALDRMRHNFGPLQIGQTARETLQLINSEHLPFSFSFETASFAAGPAGTASVINIEPASGVVGPSSTLPLCLSFAPALEKHFNFNVELKVKNKPAPLVLNVKGEGYAIHDSMQLQAAPFSLSLPSPPLASPSPSSPLLSTPHIHPAPPQPSPRDPLSPQDAGGRFVEISPHVRTLLDFGEVHINDKSIRQLQVSNTGRYNFDVKLALKLPPGARPPPVSIVPELATVKKNERATFQIAYHPSSDAPLPPSLLVTAAVTNGRSYQLQLLGRGRKPRLSFSTNLLDFGPTFVVTPKNGMEPKRERLRLVNEDDNEVSSPPPPPSCTPRKPSALHPHIPSSTLYFSTRQLTLPTPHPHPVVLPHA